MASDVRTVTPEPAAAAPSPAQQPGGRGTVTELPQTTTQKTIAQRMSDSRAQVPEFTLEAEIDMDGAARLREDLRAGGVEPLPSFNDLVVRAAALALRDHPGLNAVLRAAAACSGSAASTSASPSTRATRCSCPSSTTPTG